MSTTRISVGGDYDVVIGTGLLDELPGLVGEGAQRVLVVHPRALAATGEGVREALVANGFEAYAAEVPDAEEAKTAQVAAFLWGVLGQAGFTRSDAIVSVGGGATTDLAGFVAATWLRGIKVVHVPTTLLAMVDAAVGGKTGINTPEGKNLVGSFHPPAGVLCDLATLETLPTHDFVAGLAEVVKCGFIADPVILDLVERTDPDAITPGSAVLRELVERAIQVKIDVVVDDLKESGRREILNYGHTMAHAIERASDYQVRHGEAVAIGSVFVAELARLAGILDDVSAQRHRATFERLGLPTRWYGASYEELRAAMAVDKKARGSRLRFVVLEGIGVPRVLADPPEEMLRAAYDLMTGGDGG